MIKYLKYNDKDFLKLCKKLEVEHKEVIKEQRSIGANCMNNLEKYKYVLVNYDNEIPNGIIALTEPVDGVSEIGRVFVEHNYRNMGIMTQMLNEVELIAKTNGAKKLRLCTYNRFISAVKLYTKFGFRKVKEKSETGFLIYMEKIL